MPAISRTKVFFLVFALLGAGAFLAFPGNASAEDVTVSKEYLDKILSKVEELSNRVQQLEKEKKTAPALPAIDALADRVQTLEKREGVRESTDVTVLREDVNELTGLMQDVERRTLMDRIQWGVELRTRADWYDFKERVPVTNILGRKVGSRHTSNEVHGLVSNRLRLNMKTAMTDNLKFTGRLVMYKNWNNDTDLTADKPWGWNAARRPSDSDLLVERAYVDYFFTPHPKLPMALTFGRLPTTDGLPTDLRENSERRSTFPSMAFDMESDGVGLSFMLDSLTGLKESALRFIYLRGVEPHETQIYRKPQFVREELEYYILQFETMLPGRWLDDIMFIATGQYLPESAVPDLGKLDSRLVLQDWDTMGDSRVFTAFLQAEKFWDSNFDWFAGFSYINLKAGDGSTYRAGPFKLRFKFDDKSGHAWYLGFRYRIPWEVLNGAKFGVEYNCGSKYYFANVSASEDPLEKLNTQGDVWDFYYIQPITKNLMARFGLTLIDDDYLYDTAQPAVRVHQKIKNMYFLLDAHF